MPLTVERVNDVLKTIVDENTGRDLVTSRSARNVKVDGTDGQSHEYKGEIGWIITQEKSHSRFRDASGYA